MLCGALTIADIEYPIINFSISATVEIYAVMSIKPNNDLEFGEIRTTQYYQYGQHISKEYIVALYNPKMNTGFGSTSFIKIYLKLIEYVKTQALLNSTLSTNSNYETEYRDGDNYLVYNMSHQLIKINIVRNDVSIISRDVNDIKYNKKELVNMLVPLIDEEELHRSFTFKDATLERLELLGFNFDWLKKKKYIPIHTLEDFEKIVISDFIKQLKLFREKPDWESFLIVIDCEGTGVNTYDDIIGEADDTVYIGISFQDDVGYGLFIKMEHFQNIDVVPLAKHLTNMFKTDPLYDREITLTDIDGSEFKYMRSEIKTSAHNMLIDIKFGLRINADIWFDYCSMQIGFNADPFFTIGHNGAKNRVKQYLGIYYPDLEDIAGKLHMGSFNLLTDLRIVMMYGCADVDLVRLYTKILITGVRSCTDYYGVDQINNFKKYDYLFMNFKARFDYKGVRVNKNKAEKMFYENKRIIKIINTFMQYYIAKVIKFRKFYDLYVSYVMNEFDVSELEMIDLDNITPLKECKWSGKFLQEVLFDICQYPILVWTTQGKKSKESGRIFKPKPAIDSEAVSYYLKFDAVKSLDEINKALNKQDSLESLKINSMYLKDDLIDPLTNTVLIDKRIFNSKRYPFFFVLQMLAPYETLLKTALVPIVELENDYRYSDTRLTTIVTRRSVSPLCTVSSESKDLYLPYTDDYYLIDTDQSAIEIRIAYGLSGDEKLINPLNNPEKETHTESCAELLNKPAYLVDKEKERKPFKSIIFGRIYGREVFSCCKEIYDGNTSPENLANTAFLMDLFDEKRKSIMNLLNKDRSDMWVGRELPPFLFNFLKLNPEKKYGRMRNIFGWTQHCEIRDDEWYEAHMKRKTGNFSIQGVASTIFRMLYTRLCLALWKKNWIQDNLVILHVDVYDEFLASYHKSIDPVELALTIKESFMVKFRNFPTLFIGTGVGHTWGEAKNDKSEIPTLLMEEYKKDFEAGKHWLGIEDHPKFFKDEIHKYKIRRIKDELININKNQYKIWCIEKLSEEFENYCVRGYLYEKSSLMFNILDKKDPIEILFSYLVFFLSKYILKENEVAKVICRDKVINVTSLTNLDWYDSETDLLNNKVSLTVRKLDVQVQDDEEKSFNYFNYEDEETIIFGTEEEESSTNKVGDVFDTASIDSWNLVKIYEYFKPTDLDLLKNNVEEIEKEYVKMQYNNFKVINNKVVIKGITNNKVLLELKLFCKNNLTTSLDYATIYTSNLYNKVQLIGKIHASELNSLDELIGNLKGV